MSLLAERRALRWKAQRSRTLRYLPLTALLTDGAIITGTALAAGAIRTWVPLFSADLVASRTLLAIPAIVALWLLVLGGFGAYQPEVFGAGTDEYKRVLHGSLYTTGIVGVLSFLAHYPLSRAFFALTFVIGVPALMLGRAAIRRGVYAARINGYLQERTVIAGSVAHVDEVARVLERESWLGYRVVGALCPTNLSETPSGIPVIGNDDVDTIDRVSRDADVLFLAGGTAFNASDLRQLQWNLEQDDTKLIVAPNVNDISSERVRIRPVGGLPLMHIDAPRWSHATQKAKRAFDIVGSLGLICLFAPLLLAIAIIIRADDRGPVFFKQTRVGRDGQPFQCIKFRTMVTNAEELLAALHVSAGYTSGLFKLKDDPRITRPGSFLRRYSLDELPQLFNVLRGEMSLVGPRPNLVQEVAQYEAHMTRRLRVRPGMTGLWQVSGRSDLSWEESIRLDLYYVDNWSMLQDMNILARTFSAVVGRGAY